MVFIPLVVALAVMSTPAQANAPHRAADPATIVHKNSTDPKAQCTASLHADSPYEQPNSDAMLTCRHEHNYITSYDTKLRAPNWSAYYITGDEARHEHGGRRSFKVDPGIPEDKQAPIHSKCWGNKWNRGHLCPSYIMSYNKEHDGPWDDTYYITNTAMQYGPFNQQTWEHLEQHTVHWIQENDKPLYIVTGTIFLRDHLSTCDIETGEINDNTTRDNSLFEQAGGDQHPTMGVPDFYYKTFCEPKSKKSIAFIGHNRNDDGVFVYSADELHKKLGFRLWDEEKCGTGEKDTAFWWIEDGDATVSGVDRKSVGGGSTIATAAGLRLAKGGAPAVAKKGLKFLVQAAKKGDGLRLVEAQ